MDDHEQYSRKINLKIDNVEIIKNETPTILFDYIKERVNALGLGIKDCEWDRCHRLGPRYEKNGKTYQKVILRLCNWRSRNVIYKNRKSLPFFVMADLTDSRQKSFEFAKDEILNEVAAQRTIDYVFIDENCKLKVKTKSKKFFAFSTKKEFLSLVCWLDKTIEQTEEIVVGDYSDRHYR